MKGTLVCPLSSVLATKMNDADMKLDHCVGVGDPLDLEQKLDECLAAYLRGFGNNVKTVGQELRASRDIAAGEELLRKYGWNVWLREIAEMNGILTEKNFAGFCH